MPGKCESQSEVAKFLNEERSQNVEQGKWVYVPRGQMVAMDTYLDDHGVLRSTHDDSCVVWHQHRTVVDDDGELKRISCSRRGIQPKEIRYDPDTGAPWCPDCYEFRPKKGDVG